MYRHKTKLPILQCIIKSGEATKLSDFVGKPVVINFWATWCQYCKEEMPYFEEIYKAEQDIQFMMINATDGEEETKEKAESYIEKNSYTFPIYYDTNLEAVMNYNLYSFPVTVFIDKDGNIRKKHVGLITKEKLQEEINKLKEDI